MDGMWFVLGAVALIAVVVAAVSVLRRPSADDLSSVRHYHSALGTLEHLAERTGQPPAPTAPDERPVDTEPQPRFYQRPDATGRVPAGLGLGADVDPSRLSPRSSRVVPPVTMGTTVPEAGSPLVFAEPPPPDRHVPDHTAAPPLSRMDRAQRHALHSMNHRPRRGVTATVVIVAALVLFGVLALVGSQRSPHKGRSGAVSATTTGHAAASTSPSVPAGGSKRHTKSTQTTAPAQIVAQTSTSGTALYPVSAAAYRLTISTTGPCWVNATSASTGSTLWTGTMQAGGVQQIQATGAIKVELGTLAVGLSVDGVPVVIPASMRSPFVVTFEPASSTSPSSTTSTTSTAFG
jgi:hypothetical protein